MSVLVVASSMLFVYSASLYIYIEREREQKPKAEPLINFILDYGAKGCTENTTTLLVGLYHAQLYILSLYCKVIVLRSSTSSS